MHTVLIADSGSTKTQWCLLNGTKKKKFSTQGISPYFLNDEGLAKILLSELLPKIGDVTIDEIHYYGTGCSNKANIDLIKYGLKKFYKKAKITVDHDLLGAAKALCGDEKGIACILGTGSNSCLYNGKKVVKNSPGLGFILGDEGSGTYLGKKVIQHYLYGTFDAELMDKFEEKYPQTTNEILDSVYKNPLPNRYLASFVPFLIENRGHYMVENIIEDSINDFFFNHIYKYRESWSMPINFVGSVAYGFKDVLAQMCHEFELKLGKVLKDPMDGLIKYHSK
ncbi:N-acetylglucosamine kinase [Ferruginibacter yonginensis]|uniref:N-acetylglucosamine kinase n=1 Tax=Ferruginibacter yonginensis TaxID=1310416 RepID=A0ABV8QP34_9BACT